MSIQDNIEARKRGDALRIAPASIRVGKDPAHVAQLLTEYGLHRGTVGVIGLEPTRHGTSCQSCRTRCTPR